jgi:hypothetical protein
MSKFEKIEHSKSRIGELKIEVLKLINKHSDKHPGLTMNEVSAVMLEVLSDANNKELKQQ